MRSGIEAVLRWAVDTEGSSRSSALIRIGLALLVWTRFSEELILYKHLSWEGLAFSASYFLWTTMMLVGAASRLSALAVGAHVFFLYFYGGYLQGNEPWTHHHIYLLAMASCLCALTPCGRSYSLDRWLAVRRAERAGVAAPAERGNLLGLRLIALQLCVMYFWTAYDKAHWGFLGGERLEQYAMNFYFGSVYPAWTGFHELMLVMAWIVFVLELALAFGLPFRRTRRWLVIPGLALHACFYVLLPVLTFSLTVVLLYLAYFDADDVHDVIERLGGRPVSSALTAAEPLPPRKA
jgi:hypothetical protein